MGRILQTGTTDRNAHSPTPTRYYSTLHALLLLVIHDALTPLVVQAQRECKVFLIYLTEGYFESQWCKMELDYAAQQRLPIVILTYDKTPTIKNDMLKIKQQHERAGGRVECFYYSFDDGDDDEKMSVVVKAIAKMLH